MAAAITECENFLAEFFSSHVRNAPMRIACRCNIANYEVYAYLPFSSGFTIYTILLLTI